MGSPLSPIVANLYMENFEGLALNTYHMKQKIWKRFIGDTSVVWEHGKEELANF